MSGASNLDSRGRRMSYHPKDFSVATPEEFVKRFGGKSVINKVRLRAAPHITEIIFIAQLLNEP